MLQPEDDDRLDSLACEFRTALRRQLSEVDVSERFTDRLVVTVPARHPETGAIVVWLDGDEITVQIGQHFHCHFETHLDEGVAPTEGERLAVQRAVDFIVEFMADSIVLRVSRQRGRVVSAATHIADAALPSPSPNQTDYLWSGPKARNRWT